MIQGFRLKMLKNQPETAVKNCGEVAIMMSVLMKSPTQTETNHPVDKAEHHSPLSHKDAEAASPRVRRGEQAILDD